MDLFMVDFSKTLIDWYLLNKRDLPWRNTQNPYKVWLSEIILQQTRVEQGYPYYQKFLGGYPNVFALANASEEEILKLWQGLGYYSRARNLHATAKKVAFEMNGRFPESFSELKKLKGVGDYTASAIASSCFKEPVAVVDGNVYRFLGRFFGIYTPINSSAALKEFKAVAQEFLDHEQAGLYNNALMEFGSKHCKPQQPLCNSCPFATKCFAFSKSEMKTLPVKIKKTTIKKRYFHYLVFVSEEGKTIINKRKGKGIWQNMYEFPLIETSKRVELSNFPHSAEMKEALRGSANVSLYNDDPVVHKLTHQHLFTHFWIVECGEMLQEGVYFSELKKIPVPVLIQNFLDSFNPVVYQD